MLSELKNAAHVVGVKQTRKAVKDQNAIRVFYAEDAEERVLRPIIDMCRETGVALEPVPTMQELGQQCGIEVGAAVAAIIKN